MQAEPAASRSPLRDPQVLRATQYKDPRNLNARIALHARFSTNLHGWTQWVMEQLRSVLPEQAALLEVGAGPGTLWTSNRARVPAGWRVWLTDFSAGMVDSARKALGQDPRFRFSVAEAAHLPARNASQDGVLAHHMLYHVPDRAAALREFARVLRPGGTASVALNGRVHMSQLFELARDLPGMRVAVEQTAGETFDLEDAPKELASVFEQVEARKYPDALEVTEAAPLAEYYASDMRFAVDDRAALERALAERIARDGAIHIAKSSGLIFARKRSAKRP